MFFLSELLRKLRRYSNYRHEKAKPPHHSSHSSPEQGELPDDLSQLIAYAKQQLFPAAPDLVIRHLSASPPDTPAALFYLDGLTDKNSLNEHVLRPLIEEASLDHGFPNVTVGNVRTAANWGDVETAILQGESVLFLEGKRSAFVFETRGWPQRAIKDPQLESSLKGAHQGFVETGTQNLALLRRYLPHKQLRISEHVVGRRSKSKVWVMYLQDVADPDVLRELESRIGSIDVDGLINTGELAEYIEDNPYSLFPQLIMTERPDSAASQLLQGRLAIIVDRSPSVIIAPATFASFFQNVDDYSTRWMIASFIRLLRFVAFLITAFLPAVYIATINYNYEVIPLDLFLSIGESRERVPFPPLLEALLMEVTLEMMREAGIRLPAPVGQTIGIVGGIVIGEAAVQAGIVSNLMIIVVATTAIASFILPSYDMGTAFRLLRFPMMLIAALFGYIGIAAGAMVLAAHLAALESLGTPYGSPLAPFRWPDMKDTFIRLPLWSMLNRPKSANPIQEKRMTKQQKPPQREPS